MKNKFEKPSSLKVENKRRLDKKIEEERIALMSMLPKNMKDTVNKLAGNG